MAKPGRRAAGGLEPATERARAKDCWTARSGRAAATLARDEGVDGGARSPCASVCRTALRTGLGHCSSGACSRPAYIPRAPEMTSSDPPLPLSPSLRGSGSSSPRSPSFTSYPVPVAGGPHSAQFLGEAARRTCDFRRWHRGLS